MAVSIIERKMLYCPKCSTTYEEGTQRFCLNDGGRLLPAPSFGKSVNSGGVFSDILNRNASSGDDSEKSNLIPSIFTVEPSQFDPANDKPIERPTFQPAFSSKFFKEDTAPRKEETPLQPLKPVVRLIKPSEVPSGTAAVGDRKSNPMGRRALNWDTPEVFVGQSIKGRYQITDVLGQDDTSITYLAEDKIIVDKEMIVRVLMNQPTDDFLSRIFAEERISLSHINHPNVTRVIDSGELLEGKPFIVMEMVDGFSVKEKLEIMDKFEPVRAAKIIRQASYALSEVHQNGILHRNLRPNNIFLTLTDAVTEQAKVTDFAISGEVDRKNLESIKYLSPEQLEGRLPNFASDMYSLAVIACEMLTGKYPFAFLSSDQLLKAQKKQLWKLTLADEKLPKEVEDVLAKALAYEPSERYPKARDFGDALVNALVVAPKPAEIESKIEKPIQKKVEEDANAIPAPTSVLLLENAKKDGRLSEEDIAVAEAKPAKAELVEIQPAAIAESAQSPAAVAENTESQWEKRSPDPMKTGSNSWLWMAGVGLLVALIAIWAGWHYALNRPEVQKVEQPQAQPREASAVPPITETSPNAAPTPGEIESPPLPRSVSQPPNTEYFRNSSLDLKGDLSRNFRGFTLYYPTSWQRNQTPTNFIDVSKSAESGTPVEQFLVSYYDSRGTYKTDSERFPKLVQESSKKLADLVTNFRLISEGEKTINNGWRAYEMKFEGAGTTKNGERISLWGKRLFVPAARPGVKSGFVITMLATSLSPDVKSVDDVGIKGELANILETFEPSTLD